MGTVAGKVMALASLIIGVPLFSFGSYTMLEQHTFISGIVFIFFVLCGLTSLIIGVVGILCEFTNWGKEL